MPSADVGSIAFFAGRMPMGISTNSLACAGVAAMIGSLRVFAADAAAPSNELETITVTAQRRSESLQDVPLSITAIDARNLEQKAIYSFFDYGGKVPNLAFADTGDGSGTARTISIRGISGDGTTGFYIDETPVPDSIDPRIVDIQRIEVLRGPQGTLYGARSMGGTVRLITEQPNFNTADGRLRMTGGHTWNTVNPDYGVDGAFNVPLIQDTMALRAVLFFQHDAGFFKRRYLSDPADAANLPATANPTTLGGLSTSTTDDVGRVNSFGGAVSLAIKPNDVLMITPRIMYQQSKANGFSYADGGSYPVPVPGTFVNAPNMHPSGYMQDRFFNLPEDSNDACVQGSANSRDHSRTQANSPLRAGISLHFETVRTVAIRRRSLLFRYARPRAICGLLSAVNRPRHKSDRRFRRAGHPGVADTGQSFEPGRNLRSGLPNQSQRA